MSVAESTVAIAWSERSWNRATFFSLTQSTQSAKPVSIDLPTTANVP
jgi:hypothetical protein